jgi:hypothetical protein
MLALAAGDRRKQDPAEGPTIKVVEIAVRRSSSEAIITIDGRIVNSGQRPIRNLVLIFDVTAMDGEVVSRQRGKVDEDPFDPGEESEFHWQMREHARAVQVSVRAVSSHENAVKVEASGPYAVE